ncbi:hypothetical protein PG993_014791 [Apiospora rasikravindrae]|uniref:Uncharacterized protein n=1 Tax=Apiospora rasikravindrae TaxID=990691 RepID=A0ABR1RP28_9PEZI
MQFTQLLAIASLAVTALAVPAPEPQAPEPEEPEPVTDTLNPDTPVVTPAPPTARSILERADAVEEMKPPKSSSNSNTNVNICITITVNSGQPKCPKSNSYGCGWSNKAQKKYKCCSVLEKSSSKC